MIREFNKEGSFHQFDFLSEEKEIEPDKNNQTLIGLAQNSSLNPNHFLFEYEYLLKIPITNYVYKKQPV